MATKPVTISPNEAAAAGCMATCMSWLHNLEPREDLYWYQISAAAAAGWALEYIRWKLNINDRIEGYILYYKSPIPETKSSSAQYASALVDGWSDYIYPRRVYTLFDVEAHFRQQTHLLVNSFNKSSPVQLVYDPATNLLVADY